jgi:hypothetical protein
VAIDPLLRQMLIKSLSFYGAGFFYALVSGCDPVEMQKTFKFEWF